MDQSALPIDKQFRMSVKLVSTDGDELPFKGFALVPEGRLALLENLAASARDLLYHHRAKEGFKVGAAIKALGARLSELQKVWDIPPSSE
jgi:hypothetical protein